MKNMKKPGKKLGSSELLAIERAPWRGCYDEQNVGNHGMVALQFSFQKILSGNAYHKY